MARLANFSRDNGFAPGTMPAIWPLTMFPLAASERIAELRRYSREVGPGPVVLETRDGWIRLPLVDLSPSGAKVHITEPLKEGTRGRLYFLPPHWRARTVEAIVWRVDLDGVVFFFTGLGIAPPSSARGTRPAGSWLWTWKAAPPTTPVSVGGPMRRLPRAHAELRPVTR